MSMRSVVFVSVVVTSGFTTPSNNTSAADVVVVNSEPETHEVAIALTSPGFKTERDGIIRRNEAGMFRMAANITNSRPWDLVVWKRTNSEMDWRFSTAYRIPREILASPAAMAILGIDPSADRVSPVYAAPGPGGTLPISTIKPWDQGVNSGGDSENARPNTGIRLGVNAYKCEEGIHIQSVTFGTAATRCVDQESGQTVQLESGDHILTVNGITPRDIPDFQRLIRSSPRTIQLKVLDGRTRRTRNLVTNLW